MKFLPSISLLLLSVYSSSLLAIEAAGVPETKPVIDPLSGSSIAQMVAGLLLVLVLVIAMAWILRRIGGVSFTGNSAMSVIGGMSMGARERVVLLQVGDEQLLIGVSPGRIQKLHVLSTPIETPTKTDNDTNFAVRLAEALRGKGK